MRITKITILLLIGISFISCKKENTETPAAVVCETLTKVWQTNIPVPPSQEATYLFELSNEQILVASFLAPNLILLDKSGDILWEFNHEVEPGLNTFITGIEELNNGNVLIAGGFNQDNHSNGFVAEIDLDQNILWQKTFTGLSLSNNYKLLKTSDGNFILSFDEKGGIGGPTSVKKIQEDGNMIWEIELSSNRGTSRLVEVENGNLFLVVGGYSSQNILFLYELEASGNLIKRHDFFHGLPHNPRGIVAISNSEVIVSGFFNDNELLTGLSNNGTVLWEKITDNPETSRERNYFIEYMKEENEFIYVSFNENQGINGFTKIGKVDEKGNISDFNLQVENVRPNCIKQTKNGYILSGYNNLNGKSEISVIKVECQN